MPKGPGAASLGSSRVRRFGLMSRSGRCVGGLTMRSTAGTLQLLIDRGRAVPDDPGGPRAFPGPEELATLEPDELKRHGFSMAKARTIIETARAIVAGGLDLEALHRFDDLAAVERLTSLRGIGRWTAEYVLLRGLGRLNVFPGDDLGAHNKLRRLFGIDMQLNYESVQQLVARLQPYAGVVYFHLLLDSLSRDGLMAQP